jgi:hypothetical protein
VKPVQIVLRRGGGGKRENDGRGKSKIYCRHKCKYHNVSPVQILYANKIIKKKKNEFI